MAENVLYETQNPGWNSVLPFEMPQFNSRFWEIAKKFDSHNTIKNSNN